MPDFYADLAAALRQLADQFATLADTDIHRAPNANLYLSLGYNTAEAVTTVPAVNAIAAAIGGTATTKFEGRGAHRRGERRADVKCGPVTVHAYASVPVPPTRAQTMAELQAENDRLRTQLSKSGEPS
ncbi:MAG: hypothetical protein ABW000_07145 [Actinoplanes sp.]